MPFRDADMTGLAGRNSIKNCALSRGRFRRYLPAFSTLLTWYLGKGNSVGSEINLESKGWFINLESVKFH